MNDDNNKLPKSINYDLNKIDNSTEKINDVMNNANLHSQGEAPTLHRGNVGSGLEKGNSLNSNRAKTKDEKFPNSSRAQQNNQTSQKNNYSQKRNISNSNQNSGLTKQKIAKFNNNNKSIIARNTLSNMSQNKNLSMKERIEKSIAGIAAAKNPLLGQALSKAFEKKNELKNKKELEDGQDGGFENFKVSYKVVLAVSILAVPVFVFMIFMVLLIPSSQIFLTAHTLGQADQVQDDAAEENINNISNHTEKLEEDIKDEESDLSSNVSYAFDIFIDNSSNESIHYEFVDEKVNISQEASLADLEEFYPEIINYTGDEYNQNDVYKFFKKLYNIYNYYLEKGYDLDIPLMMSVLELQSNDMGEVFKANTVDFDENDTSNFEIDKDWSNYKPTRTYSAHDMEVIAQAMSKAIVRGTSESKTSSGNYTFLEGGFNGKIYYFNQCDPAYSDSNVYYYGSKGNSYCDNACGPFSLTIAMSSLLGKALDPKEVVDYTCSLGYCHSSGTSWAAGDEIPEHYGLKSKRTSDRQEVLSALSTGNAIVMAIMCPGHFTTGGHFITLTGVNKDGTVSVADPGYTDHNKNWDFEIVSSESCEGGNFWIITK